MRLVAINFTNASSPLFFCPIHCSPLSLYRVFYDIFFSFSLFFSFLLSSFQSIINSVISVLPAIPSMIDSPYSCFTKTLTSHCPFIIYFASIPISLPHLMLHAHHSQPFSFSFLLPSFILFPYPCSHSLPFSHLSFSFILLFPVLSFPSLFFPPLLFTLSRCSKHLAAHPSLETPSPFKPSTRTKPVPW